MDEHDNFSETMDLSKKEYYFLSKREHEVIEVVAKYHDGYVTDLGRKMAANELGINQSTVVSILSNIRKKVESAYRFKRRYGKVIERQR